MEHVFTESMFLVGFVIFIAAILVLDMLVIDRKAHVVSIKLDPGQQFGLFSPSPSPYSSTSMAIWCTA